jgi:hypothetical protein
LIAVVNIIPGRGKMQDPGQKLSHRQQKILAAACLEVKPGRPGTRMKLNLLRQDAQRQKNAHAGVLLLSVLA